MTGDPATPAPAVDPPTRRTRTSVAWTSTVIGVIVLILLLVFMLENTESVKVSFFGAHGHLPLGVALLLAAVGGALLVALVAVARLAQLRVRARRATRAAA
jgi:putative membrane protein